MSRDFPVTVEDHHSVERLIKLAAVVTERKRAPKRRLKIDEFVDRPSETRLFSLRKYSESYFSYISFRRMIPIIFLIKIYATRRR